MWLTHLGRGGELLGHEERLVPRPPGVPRLDEGEGPGHAVGGEAGVIPLGPRVRVIAATALKLPFMFGYRRRKSMINC